MMKKSTFFSFVMILISISSSFGQSTTYPCGFDIVHKQKMLTDRNYDSAVHRLNTRWIKYATLLSSASLTFTSSGYVYEIPMVVHVLHTGGAVGTSYNPDSTKIAQMVDYLNNAYAAVSPFPDTTSGGCRIPLKFVLAKRTPTGTATNGIVRINASSLSGYTTYGANAATSSGVDPQIIMNFSRWNPADYFNVYCVNKIDGNDLYSTGGIAGFAYFPGYPSLDGMIVAASQVKSGSTTVAHEFGHAFSLYHTFEGDADGTACPSTSSCTTTGDLICDTEPHIRESSAYPSTWCPPSGATNSCTGLPYNNVQYNIMDYTTCPPNRFTAGQRTRVLNTLNNERTGFKTSFGLLAPTSTVTTACTPTATSSGYNIGPYIVDFNGINVWTGDSYMEGATYIDHSYTQQSFVTRGTAYTINITTAVNKQIVKVFIDYNNDGDFADAGESVFSHSGTVSGTEVHSGTITIPTTATTCAFLRMRVVADFISASVSDYACGPYVYGQAEDYAIYVKSDTPSATTTYTYCQGVAASALTATGSSLKWYTTATGGTGSSTAPTPSTSTVGATIYYVSQSGDSSSTCEGNRTAITVNVTASPSAPTVTSPVNYCVGATASALTATGTSLLWYTSSTGGVGSSTAPTPTTTSAGSTTYYVSQTSGTCESPRASIAVNVNALPSAPIVTTPIVYCQGVTALPLTATATTTGDTLYWYTIATGGIGSVTAPTPSTATSAILTYYVSEKSVYGCESNRTLITVNINAAPASPTVTSPVTYCQDATTSALATPSGSGIKWYTATTGGTASTTAPTPSSTTPGIITYYVTQTNGFGCENIPRAIINVVINPKPASVTATALTATSFCIGDSVILNGNASVFTNFGNTQFLRGTAGSGTISTCDCPNGSVAVGYEGRTGAWIDQFNLICKPINRFGVIGSTTTATSTSGISVGPTYFGPYVLSSTNLLVGMKVRDESYTPSNFLGEVTGYGQSMSYITALGDNTSGATALSTLGGWSASSVLGTVWAPNGTVFMGMYSYSTYYASGVSLRYTPIGAYKYSYTWSTADTNQNITVKSSGSYTLTVTNSLGCSATSAAVNVNVSPYPTAPTVTTPVVYCQGVTAIPLTATKATSTDTLYWYTAATGGTGSAIAPTPSTATPATLTYYVSAKNITKCEGPRSLITVNINPTSTAPSVATPIAYCQGATALPLVATKSTPTDTLYWYTTATGGTGTTTAPTPSTATSGTTLYYVGSRNTSNCESPRSTVTVNINPTPTAPVVTTPVIYCQGTASSPLSATKLATSDTLLWYAAATGGTPSLFTVTPATTMAATTLYYVSLKTMFGCEGPRSSISVTVNPTPTAPTVTTPVKYCQGVAAIPLTATKALATDTLNWYSVAIGGTGSITAPTPTTTSVGSTTFYVSEKTPLNCEGPRSAITVNVNPTPIAPVVTSAVAYCQGATAVPLTATKASTTDTLYWYTVATGGTGSITAPTPSTATAATLTYYVSAKNTSSCEGSRSLITVTINSLPAAPTVTTPVNFCLGGGSSALTATGTSLLWYTAATGGIGTGTAPIPNTSVLGTTVYYVSQTSGTTTCESPRSAISAVVNALPSAPVVTSPVTYCQGTTVVPLTATKSVATDTLYWYTVATGGTGSVTAPTPSTVSVGTTSYYVSIKSIFGCEGPRSLIAVTVNATPSVPVVTSPVVYCQNAVASPLSATKSTSTDTLRWYTVATGGTASTTTPTPSTAVSGTFFSYVSLKNNLGCEGLRSTITITINPAPAVPTVTTPVNLCVGGSSAALTATGTSLLWYTSATGGIGSFTAPTPSTSATGTTLFYVTQTESVNLCESPRAIISVVVNPLPAAPTVVSPLNLCIGSVGVPLTATGTNLKWYSTATSLVPTGTPTPNTTSVGSTNYFVSQTSTVGCEGPRATLTVTIQPLPVVSVAAVGVPGFFFCAGKKVMLKATSATAISYQWFSGTTAITGATFDTFSTGTTGYYKVQVANSYGCIGEQIVYAQKDTTAFPALAPTIATICEEGATLLYCHPGYVGFVFDWIKDGISMTPATPSSNTRSVNLAGTYKVTVTNLYNCVNTTNTGVVTIYPKPVKPTIIRVDPLLTLTTTGYSYYQWYRNGTKIIGANADNYTFTTNGYYYAEVTDGNGCLNYSDTVNVNGLNIGFVQNNGTKVKVYPNPTRDVVYIDAPIKVNVRVTDIVGKVVFEQKNATSVSLEHFTDGSYFFRISDENDQLISIEKITKMSTER